MKRPSAYDILALLDDKVAHSDLLKNTRIGRYICDKFEDQIMSGLQTGDLVVRETVWPAEKPYIDVVTVVSGWNPNYDQNKLCACGHEYNRHFDSYDVDHEPVGCKYCSCYVFEERKV